MNSEILTLCDYASERDGKLTIVDTFDAIAATKFPWRAYFYIAARINVSDCVSDYKSITIRILSAVDKKTTFEASEPCAPLKNVNKLNLVAGLKGFIFETAGDYTLQICLDETIVGEHTFKVMLKEENERI